MPSANGFRLHVDGHDLVASWPAAFFILIRVDTPVIRDEKPLLIHCEDRADADRRLRFGGQLLDSQFMPVE